MEEFNQNPYRKESSDCREQRFYQTGSTRPPKNHRGLMAFLLIALIFVGGIASALGLLNVQLFRKLNTASGSPDNSVHFSPNNTDDSSQDTQQSFLPSISDPSGFLNINQSPESVENVPQAGGLSLQDIYSKAIPSVVSISCLSASGASSGTGVIVSSDGYIVTNCHVVENASQISVKTTDQKAMTATVVGLDETSDLAVLYVQAAELIPAEFGDSSALRVGDTVAAIGDPLGAELRGTMTDGIVSAINRDITTDGRTMTLIQTNAALNAGNSGGPLLNCYGQVIGINTMKIGDYMSDAGVEGLGFAIPSTTVKEIVDQLLSQGYVSGRPSLGLSGYTLSSFDQTIYRLPKGVFITQVDPESDAAAKGIVAGDILLGIDNTRTVNIDTVKMILHSLRVGDSVSLRLYRSGREISLSVTVGEAK